MCRRFDTIPACDLRTDGQTDGIAIASTALAMRALWRAVKMNLSTVKWAQWDKTHSRELLRLFICVCIALCTTVVHNIAQSRADNFPSYPQTIIIAPMMSIWGKGESWNLAEGESVKSCVICRTRKKNKISPISSSRNCADRAQNLPGPTPDNVLRVLQILSKSVDFRWSYIRTREHRQSALQSESSIRLKFSFEPNNNN